MVTTIRALICAQRGEFCQVSIFAKLVCQTVGDHFFLVLSKLDGCQIDFSEFWSCRKGIGKSSSCSHVRSSTLLGVEKIAGGSDECQRLTNHVFTMVCVAL
jgi:hypothetical protein